LALRCEQNVVCNLRKINSSNSVNLAQLLKLLYCLCYNALRHLPEALNDNWLAVKIEDLLVHRLVCVASIAFV
jgi:hypothetical protein